MANGEFAEVIEKLISTCTIIVGAEGYFFQAMRGCLPLEKFLSLRLCEFLGYLLRRTDSSSFFRVMGTLAHESLLAFDLAGIDSFSFL